MGPRQGTPGRLLGIEPTLYVTWITLLTIVTAFVSSDPIIDRYLRPLFFAALLSFFLALGRSQPGLRSLPFRLIEMGFLLLSVGSLGATALRAGAVPIFGSDLVENLAFGLDRGVGFLLGFSLLSYGIVLWVPEVLESQRLLRAHLEAKGREAAEKGQALKKAEDVIVRQEALVSVGELSAGVAHELRNPLAIVSSALQRLKSGDLGADEERRCLDAIARAVHKANRRIRGLLDLGRATEFTPRTCGARDFLQKCVDLARPQARVAGVEIELEADDATFHADPDLLLQVLLNLLRNAIQAHPHHGPIRLRFAALAGGASRFIVEDSGCGIEAGNLQRLFTPFFTTKPDGTGIGLTVSANLIEKHGGHLWLAQRAEGGTRACIELEGQRGAPTPAPQAAHV